MAKKPYATTMDENILKAIKIKAIEEDRPVNEILEKLILHYLAGNIKI